MRLLHATDAKNLPGIRRVGLLASMSTGKRAAVWAVVPALSDYAVKHCLAKRKVPLKDIVVLELNVPRAWLKRFCVSGFVYINRDVPPERIRVYGRCSLVRE